MVFFLCLYFLFETRTRWSGQANIALNGANKKTSNVTWKSIKARDSLVSLNALVTYELYVKYFLVLSI